jgi:hypothetical protein
VQVGVDELDDLFLLDTADLQAINMKTIHARKVMKAIELRNANGPPIAGSTNVQPKSPVLRRLTTKQTGQLADLMLGIGLARRSMFPEDGKATSTGSTTEGESGNGSDRSVLMCGKWFRCGVLGKWPTTGALSDIYMYMYMCVGTWSFCFYDLRFVG